MSENNKTAKRNDDDLKKVNGGKIWDEGLNYVTGTAEIHMFTSSMKEITGSSNEKFRRIDSDIKYIVSSVSNNYNPGDNTAFSTTFLFKSEDGGSMFSFVATKENNICPYLA